MLIEGYDVVIVGSGFGGSMLANKLSKNGMNVAIIEKGDYIERSLENWKGSNSLDLTKYNDLSVPYNIIKGGNKPKMGTYSAVGGPSIFYGGVSFRFREKDFISNDQIIQNSKAEWPIQYKDLENYYDVAERILNVSGQAFVDPTEPNRKSNFPQQTIEYSDISKKIKESAQSLGLNPFHLPLAINYNDENRATCKKCTTCDTFACAIGAKNDLDTIIYKKNEENNAFKVYHNTIAFKYDYKGDNIELLHCQNKITGESLRFKAKIYVLSAGALASPHLILNSNLDKINPAGKYIGKYLMRHVNSIVFGVFKDVPDTQNIFHKELAIMDYYFGDNKSTLNKIGSLQQVSTPPKELVENALPFPLNKIISKAVKHITGLLSIAEDQPQEKNKISVDTTIVDKFGLGKAMIEHEYSNRDKLAVQILNNHAKKIMLKTGAKFNYVHHIKTFSHAVGTVRMGPDENFSPLDMHCNFRGLDNLFVVDGSFMPTSAAVNPSLTIAANALRVGDYIINKIHEN